MFTQIKNIVSDNNRNSNAYSELIEKVAALDRNHTAKSILKAKNLQVMRVAWEDTSRFKGSCVGSNITDLTLKVESTRMPIIRGENFVDCTVDLEFDKLPRLVVGNESGSSLTKVTLKEYLQNFEKYCGVPSCEPMDLYCERDAHVLTSAQACVLPTDNGKVEFAVDLYNYQSRREPAVLIVMATAYGTSAQVVSGGNTVLYFNGNSTSRLFKAERLTEYRISQGRPVEGPMTSEEKALNGIYIFQVPLKIQNHERVILMTNNNSDSSEPDYGDSDFFCDDEYESCAFGNIELCSVAKSSSSAYSNVELCSVKNSISNISDTKEKSMTSKARGMERAILTVGEEKGPFEGINKSSGGVHTIIRDADKPIRLTVQFYLCSDTDDISMTNVDDICGQIRHIYDQGLNEGSLVVDHSVEKPGLDANKNTNRPTATTNSYKPVYLNNNIL